jgi:hypothetical protein
MSWNNEDAMRHINLNITVIHAWSNLPTAIAVISKLALSSVTASARLNAGHP